MLSEPVLVVAKLARLFDALGIRYVVGGSVASSMYGIPRATQDVDLVADIRLSHVDTITSALTGEFYVDADMIVDAWSAGCIRLPPPPHLPRCSTSRAEHRRPNGSHPTNRCFRRSALPLAAAGRHPAPLASLGRP
jgi:hypothetical protein